MNYLVLSSLLTTFLCSMTTSGEDHPSVCKQDITVSRNEVEYYNEYERCGYYESCWSRKIRKSRMKVVFDTRHEYYCCHGNHSMTFNHLNQRICKPICSPPCENSDCVAPGNCSCKPGFEKIDNHRCQPACEPSCVNGRCASVNLCECFKGYVKDGNTSHVCSPHCSHDCVNGYCYKPNNCACNSSYFLSNDGITCLPICTLECQNSRCVAPDRCECDVGYVDSVMWNLCEPYCSEPCENALCTSPEVCTCLEGYFKENKEDTYKCMPRCSKECVNGMCIAPEECGCIEGFEMDTERDLCVPVCSDGCDHGECVAPEKCICNQGYEKLNGSCVPHCDEICINGMCAAPNECACNNGTLKASPYRCLMTCDESEDDQCYHELNVRAIPAALISLRESRLYVDIATNISLTVPCDHLSYYRGVFQNHYHCYSSFNSDTSLTVVCSADSPTLDTNSLEYVENALMANATFMENSTLGELVNINVIIVHRNVSKYCTTYLCSDSNRTLYVESHSVIHVCMDKEKDRRTGPLVLILISGALGVLLVITVERRYCRSCEKVSYTINSRNHSISSQCEILEAVEGSRHVDYEHMETFDLPNNEDEPIT